MNRSNFVYSVIITSFLITGIAFAVAITAPDVPRFGDFGPTEIDGTERATWEILVNFTASGAISIGDRLYLLNGTDALAANFTTAIFTTIHTQTDIDRLSMNFTSGNLTSITDGTYLFRSQWVDVDGGGEGGPVGDEAAVIILDSDTSPTATLTPTPTSPSGSKTSLSFAIQFSEPMGQFVVADDIDIDFTATAGTFANAGGTLTQTDSDTYTYTLSAGELGQIGDGLPAETVTLRLLNSVLDTGTNGLTQVDSVWTFDASLAPSPGKSNNLGCWGDCTSPTIGLDKYQKRMVDGGFSYNGNSVDAIKHHTPFPLISAQIGQTNTVTVKVYDEYGPQGVKLVQFALGLPEIGSPLDNAEAIIAIWLESGGNNVEKVTITDKHNLIENSSVKTQTEIVDCREGSADQCIQVTMKYQYREASIYNVMRVNVMDNYRNLQANTFNDGVEVLGESMNPADITTTQVPNMLYPQQRGLVELTNIDRGEKLWIDPYGYVWQGDDSKMVLLSIIPLKEQDNDPKSVWSGYNDRINSNFAMYKQEQIDKAQEIFDTLFVEIQGDDLTDYVAETMNYGIVRDRTHDSVLQQALIDEANRAELILEELLSKTHFANIHY